MKETLKPLGVAMEDFFADLPGASAGNLRLTVDAVAHIYLGMKNPLNRGAILNGFFKYINGNTLEETQTARIAEAERLTAMLTENQKLAADAVAADFDAHFERINNALIAAFDMGMKHEKGYIRIYSLGGDTGMEGGGTASLAGRLDSLLGFMKSRREMGYAERPSLQLGLFGTWIQAMSGQEHAAKLDPSLAFNPSGLIQDFESKNTLWRKGLQAASALAGWIDRATRSAGFMAVYNSVLESTADNEFAISEAGRIVKMTQLAPHAGDRTALAREESVKLLMRYSGDLMQKFQTNTYDLAEIFAAGKDPAGVPVGTADRVLKFAAHWLSLGLGAALAYLITNGLPLDDDDESWGEWAKNAMTADLIGKIPIVGAPLSDIFTSGRARTQTSVFFDPVKEAMMASGLWGDDERRNIWMQTYHAARLVSYFTPLPVTGLARAARAGYRVLTKGEVINAFRILMGHRVKEREEMDLMF